MFSARARCAICLVLVVMSAGIAAPVYLCGQVAPTVTFNKKFAPPTAKVLVSGKGFSAGSSILIQFDQSPVGQAHTDANGTFTKAVVKIPGRVTEGSHVFGVSDSFGINVQIPFLIETDWPQKRFEPGNSAYNPYEWKLDTTTVGSINPAWNTMGRPGPCLQSTAIKYGDVVYFVNGNAGLQALDPATGKLLWGLDTSGGTKANCGTSPTASPGAGHLVSLGNAKGEVWAVSTVTHKKVWSDSGFVSFPYGTWPISVGGSLFLVDSKDDLTSVNQVTGVTNWNLASYSFNRLIAYNGGVLYTLAKDSACSSSYSCPVGRSANTGALTWYDDTDKGVGFAPVASGTVAYFGSSPLSSTYVLPLSPSALDTTTDNNDLWNFGGQLTDLALSKGRLYFTWLTVDVGVEQAYFGAANTADGSVAFSVPLTIASSPIVANGVVYVGIQSGTDCSKKMASNSIEAFDATNGNLLWTYTFSGSCSNNVPPVPSAVVDGTLFVTNSTDGTTSDLWAFR